MTTVARNRIGVLPNGVAAPNVQYGVRMEAVTRITFTDNEIAFNGKGVQLLPTTTNPTNLTQSPSHSNRFSRNLIHDNGGFLAFDMLPMGTPNDATHGNVNVNDDIRIPVLSAQTATTVNVQTCAGCVVELFVATANTTYGGSTAYVASATADGSGVVQMTFAIGAGPRKFTATATNANSSTSEFARNVTIP